MDWWFDLPVWARLAVSLLVLGVSLIFWFQGTFLVWGWAIGVAMLCFSFSAD